MSRLVPAVAVGLTLAFCALTACTSTVPGAAVKAQSSLAADDVPPLDESALDELMLSMSELSDIAGTDLESFYESDEMNDNADLVSDVDCIGAIYPGEDAAYDGTGWTAVRDELLLEDELADDAFLVEQTIVLFDTSDDAAEFFESSREKWRECARAEDITVEDGDWVPEEVVDVDERLFALKAEVSGTLEGVCQHAMGVVSNLIVEGFSCDVADHDDAQRVAASILENAADQ